MSTPALHLQTLFELDGDGRISGTREPESSPGPLFSLIRGNAGCAWAVRSDVPWDVAEELDGLVREETLISDLGEAPVHAERYMSLVQGSIDAGPAFSFPDEIAQSCGTVIIEDIRSLDRHFSGWVASEIPERTPIVALVDEGCAVSICFSARRSNVAAEAGLEMAVAFVDGGSVRELPLRGP